MHSSRRALAVLLAVALSIPPSALALTTRNGVRIGTSDIGGVVRSAHGPEAGVWVT